MVYVGQSVDIERRWKEERTRNENTYITRAIRKYGIKNFTFEVLELCSIEELDAKEQEYIKKFNSNIDGYNLTLGGQKNKRIYKWYVPLIINELKNTNITELDIGLKYNLSDQAVSDINVGKTYTQENEEYPLRKKPTKEILMEKTMISKEELQNDIYTEHMDMKNLCEKYQISEKQIRVYCNRFELKTPSKLKADEKKTVKGPRQQM